MRRYEEPEMEITVMASEDDVITASTLVDGGTGGGDGSDWNEWSPLF